ncbi:calcium-binding protein [Rhizorhabdus sp. FW153]|uniref:calcium-binding protein n=1 Tax=Rhizorhabdus sp. FW153 TaxID=3400216 RepID=UPI003CF1CF31
MAEIISDGITPINFNNFSPEQLSFSSYSRQSTTEFYMKVDYVEFRFSGGSFSYDEDGIPVGGTITKMEEISNGVVTYSIIYMHDDVSKLHSYILEGNPFVYMPLLVGNDTLKGGSGDDILLGLDGHDIITGGAGFDEIYGGFGNDHLYGQSAGGGLDDGDVIVGNEGNDYIQGNAGNDSIDGGGGSDRINGGSGNDRIGQTGLPLPNFGDTDGNDTVNGNQGDDTIYGGVGNDSLRGGQGNDVIYGDQGNDILVGDLGNDRIIGAAGFDLMTGGPGSDIFKLDGDSYPVGTNSPYIINGPNSFLMDIITDFSPGEDYLIMGSSSSGQRNISVHHASNASEAAAIPQNNNDYIAVQVGSDTFMFYYQNAVLLIGVNAEDLQPTDFI